MNVKQFSETVAEIAADVGCNGSGRTGSHDIPSQINVYVDNGDDIDYEYELVEIETDRLGGCGCASGITLRIKRL